MGTQVTSANDNIKHSYQQDFSESVPRFPSTLGDMSVPPPRSVTQSPFRPHFNLVTRPLIRPVVQQPLRAPSSPQSKGYPIELGDPKKYLQDKSQDIQKELSNNLSTSGQSYPSSVQQSAISSAVSRPVKIINLDKS